MLPEQQREGADEICVKLEEGLPFQAVRRKVDGAWVEVEWGGLFFPVVWKKLKGELEAYPFSFEA